VFLTFSSQLSASAETTNPYPYIGQVNAEQTQVHKGATVNYQVALSLNKGDVVSVIGEITNNSNEEWLNIAAKGLKGWVKKTSVSIIEAPSTLFVNKQGADVRKGASASYQSVKTVDYGQKVTVIDSYVSNDGYIWYRIDLGAVQGWVKSEHVNDSPVPTVLQTNKTATIHSGADFSYRTVAKLDANKELKIIDQFINKQQEVWYRVELQNGDKGWIHAELTAAVQENSEQVQQSYVVYVKNINSKIHSGALDTYKVVHSPKQNESLKVIDEFTNNQNQKWLRVELPNGVKGWIIETAVQDEPLHEDQMISDYVFVKENGIVARKGALDKYGVVETFAKNEDLRVIDAFINDKDELWYRVQISDTDAGWIHSTDTIKEPKLNTTYYLMESGVVRSGAQDIYRVLASLPKGSAIYVVDTFINNNKELWYRVKLENGELGWINASTVTSETYYLNETLKVGTNDTYLRKGAMYHYTKVTKLALGSNVQVLFEFINNDNQHWYNAKLSNGKTGWIPVSELYKQLSDRQFVYPLESNVLHKSASSSSGYNTKVQAGEKLIYLWTFNDWMNVENSKGIRGWILKADTREFIPNSFANPKVSTSGNAYTLTWEKTGNFAVGYKQLSNGVVQLTGQNLHAEMPSESIKGLKTIQATSSSITLTPESGYLIDVRNNATQTQIKIMPKGIQGKKIIIDAGHGDQDPGAVGPTQLQEKTVTLDVAKKLKTELERQGAIVTLTRSTDVFLSLAERVEISNSSDHDAFISIHANANDNRSANGTETYFNTSYNFNGSKSSLLAKNIQETLVGKLNTYDRGTKTANYYVLKNNELPSALVELAFISNPQEESMLRSDIVRGQAAVGIADGIKNYFNGGN
jgi:N-acetylmuramoyl-L-alanine amidase